MTLNLGGGAERRVGPFGQGGEGSAQAVQGQGYAGGLAGDSVRLIGRRDIAGGRAVAMEHKGSATREAVQQIFDVGREGDSPEGLDLVGELDGSPLKIHIGPF